MTTPPKIVVVGNAVIDLMASIDDAFFTTFNLEPGNHYLATDDILNYLHEHAPQPKTVHGGAGANTAYGLAAMGADVTFVSSIAADTSGVLFMNKLHDVGVKTQLTNYANTSWPEKTSPVKGQEGYVLTSTNGERTFISLPYNTMITPDIVDLYLGEIINADWVILEGYLFENQMDAVERVLELTRENNVNIALTLGTARVTANHAEAFAACLVDGVQLLHCNGEEMETLIHALRNNPQALEALDATPRVITHGADGCVFIQDNKNDVSINGVDVEPERIVDTSGAGDAFLAGFLYAYARGDSLESAICACIVAAKSITEFGPRIPVTEGNNPYKDSYQEALDFIGKLRNLL